MGFMTRTHLSVRWTASWLLISGLLFALTACGSSSSGGGGGGGGQSTAAVFVADVTGAIYQVSLDTGALTHVADSGVPDIYALAYDSTTQKVFAGTGTSGVCEGCVYSLDLNTWQAAQISGANDPIWDMTVPPTSGILYALTNFECGDELGTIDKETGNRNGVGPACPGQYGLTHSADGSLYVAYDSAGATLGVLDGGGNIVSGTAFSWAGPFSGGPSLIYEMAPHPTKDAFVGITDSNELGVIDRCSAVVTHLSSPGQTITAVITVHSDPLPAPVPCG